MVGPKFRCAWPSLAILVLATPTSVDARSTPNVVQNPNHNPSPQPVVIDLSQPGATATPPEGPAFSDLDDFASTTPDPDITRDDTPRPIGHGLVQVGSMVMPEEMLDGADMVSDATRAWTSDDRPSAGGGAPDIEEICAFPEEVPAGVYGYDQRPGGETPRFTTVYMNYLGGVLTTGGENSAENISNIARPGHMYPVYAGGEMRAIAAAQAVAADFEDWAVRVVYEQRPPKRLPYTMVMMGGSHTDTTSGPAGGVAPLDCEDNGLRNVCYVFQNVSPASVQANIASQEIGHTLGLGHTNASDSVMAAGYAPTQAGDLGFNETCAETISVAGQAGACTGVNRCHCGVPDSQHDKNTMSATFALAGVDMVEPTIEITDPPDGTRYAPGDDVVIQVDPWDDFGGYGWELTLEDAMTGEVLAEAVDYDRALEFRLSSVPDGSYRAIVTIQDHADHITTDEITFTVGDAAAASSSGGEETDGDDATSGSGGDDSASGGNPPGDTDGDADSGGSGGGGSLDDDNGGCGCAQGTTESRHGLLLALFGLIGLRRRNGHRSQTGV